MADDKTATNEEQKPKKQLPIKTIIVIAVVMLLEGAVFMVVSSMSEPKVAEAGEPIAKTDDTLDLNTAELVITDKMSVDNWVLGSARTIVTLQVVASTKKDKLAILTPIIEENKNQIRDRIISLVGRAQPDSIRDPDRQVLKREIKAAIEAIIGEGLIDEVLLPEYSSVTID